MMSPDSNETLLADCVDPLEYFGIAQNMYCGWLVSEGATVVQTKT
jgi:hypothetical protein